MISIADQAPQHHPRSSLSVGVVRRLAGLLSPDVTCNEHDGRSQKKDALFAADTCPRSGFERFHSSHQADLSWLQASLYRGLHGLASLESAPINPQSDRSSSQNRHPGNLGGADCYHLKGNGGTAQAGKDLQKLLLTGEYTHVIRSDAKGYYENIQHHKLLTLLGDLGFSKNVRQAALAVCQRLVCKGGVYTNPQRGIPAGCVVSPLFSAIYLSPLDSVMQQLKGVAYIRYMDDWIILCKSRWIMRRAVKLMHQTLSQLDLVAHPQKTFIGKVSKGFDFLGVDYAPASIADTEHPTAYATQPSTVSLDRLRAKLTEHFSSCVQFYEQGQLRNLARIERYLTHWLSWAKGAGIALPDSLVAIARQLRKICNETCCGMTSLFTKWMSHWVNQQKDNKIYENKNNKKDVSIPRSSNLAMLW
jgi:hypothetical protein